MKIRMIMDSWKSTFKQIWNSKFSFLMIIIAQAIFIGVISFIFYHFSVRIMDYREAIIDPLQRGALYNLTLMQQASPSINDNYNLMLKNIVLGFISMFGAYLLINGMIWELSSVVISKKFSHFKYMRKFIIFASWFILPGAIVTLSLLGLLLEISDEIAIVLSLAIVLFIAYFMYIALCMIDRENLDKKEVKEHIMKAWRVGVKEWMTLIGSYLNVIIPLIINFIALILLAETAPIYLIMILLILPVFILIFGRLFLINLIRKLSKGVK